jgi:hypothetical protein
MPRKKKRKNKYSLSESKRPPTGGLFLSVAIKEFSFHAAT